MDIPIQAQAVDFTITVPVGKPQRIDFPGTFVRVINATANFQLTLGRAAPFSMIPGSQYTCPAGSFYPNVTITNLGATDDLIITVTLGQGDIRADAAPLLERRTTLVAAGNISLGAGAQQDFPGTPTASLAERKQFLISNKDPSGSSIELMDVNGTVALTVFFQTSVAIPLSGFIRVHNPNAGAVAISVGEIWFVNQ